jgi:hypothetical protein
LYPALRNYPAVKILKVIGLILAKKVYPLTQRTEKPIFFEPEVLKIVPEV